MTTGARAREYRGGVEVAACVIDDVSGVFVARVGACSYRDREVGRLVVGYLERRREVGSKGKLGARIARFAKRAAKKIAKSKALGKIWNTAKNLATGVLNTYTGGAYQRIADAALKGIAKVAPPGSKISKIANAVLPGGPVVNEKKQRDGAIVLAAGRALAKGAS